MNYDEFKTVKEKMISEAFKHTNENISVLLSFASEDVYGSENYKYHMQEINGLLKRYNAFREYLEELDMNM